MVEEAGQVLEAHVLTSLVPSGMYPLPLLRLIIKSTASTVHHVIFIGDPQQLRPNLATFGNDLLC